MPTNDRDLAALDRTALQACLDRTLSDPDLREHYTGLLQERGWLSTALSACYGIQIDALRLKPWQNPPMCLDGDKIEQIIEDGPDGPGRANFAAARLLQQMLRFGVSQYHPDPASAITEARAKCGS